MAVSDLNIRIQASFRDFDKSMRQIERRLQQSAQTFGNIGNAMAGAITLPLAALGATAISAAGDFEQMSNSLNTVMTGAGYSVNQTAAELEKLRKISLAPGIDMEQAVKGSIRLQSVGFSAEKARNVLVELANALSTSGGDAQQLDGVTRQFAQMSAKGKVMQEDLTIILENMPSLAKVLMDTFGTTNAEAIRNMGVNAEQFIDKITQGLSKTERAQGGIKNAITNAQTALKSFFSTIGLEINKAYDLNAIAGTIGDKLKAMADAFRNLDPETKKSIISFALYAAAAGPIVKIFQGLYSGAALAVSGIRAIAGTLGGLHASAVNTYTAFSKLSTTMKFTLVGGVIAGVMALAAAYEYVNRNVQSALHVTERLNEVQKKGNEYAGEQIGKVDALVAVVKNETIAQDKRRGALEELQSLYPKYFANLDKENINIGATTAAYEKLKESIIRASMVRAAEEGLNEVAKTGLSLQDRRNKLIENYNKNLSSTAELQVYNNAVTQAGRAETEALFASKRKNFAQELAAIDKQIEAQKREFDALVNVRVANTDLGEKVQETTKATVQAAASGESNAKALKRQKEEAKAAADSMQELIDMLDVYDAATEQQNKALAANTPTAVAQLPLVAPTSLTADFVPSMLLLGDAVNDTGIKIEGMGDAWVATMERMGASASNMSLISQGLSDMAASSQEAFTGVANSLMGVEGAYTRVGVAALIAAMQMVKAALAATLAKAIQQSVTRSGHPLLGIALAGAATAGINALFGKIQQSVSKVPKFAKGAVVYGPTLAMVGDNRGASVDPEVIAPLSKLKSIMGSNSGSVEVYGRISGRDILLSNEKTAREMRRTR